MNLMLEAALDYASRGWLVFPIHEMLPNGSCSCRTRCLSPGKHPYTRWQTSEPATTDGGKITEWWTRWPDANIGVATGPRSNLLVLDVDNGRSVDIGGGVLMSEGDHSLRVLALEYGDLPPTLAQRTGSGGTHFLFAYPEDEREYRNRTGFAPSLDVRGDGGYILVDPSNHQSGHHYTWLNEGPVLPAPDEYLALFRRDRPSPIEPLAEGEKVGEGGRNDHLFKIGSYYRGVKQLGFDEIFGILMVKNLSDLEEPLSTAEVRRIARNAAARDVNDDDPTADFSDAPGTGVDHGGDRDGANGEIDPGADLAMSLFELTTAKLTPPDPLVHDFIDSGTGIIIAGPPGVGKSWLGFSMALSIATGMPYLDEYATTQHPVLVIDEEGTEWGDQSRMALLLEGLGIGSVKDIPLYFAIGKDFKLDQTRGLNAVRRMIDRYQPKLVMIDSLARAHTGDENLSKDMARFFGVTQKLKRHAGSAFMFIHHVRKASILDSDDPGELIRGTSEIRAWVDTAFVVKRGSEGNDMVVHNVKQRWREELPSFGVRLLKDIEGQWIKLGHMGPIEVTDNSTSGMQNRIISILSELAVEGESATVAAIAYRLGRSTNTTRDHLKRLVAGGMVREHPTRQGTVYLLTTNATGSAAS